MTDVLAVVPVLLGVVVGFVLGCAVTAVVFVLFIDVRHVARPPSTCDPAL